jgi:hypothetical protein
MMQRAGVSRSKSAEYDPVTAANHRAGSRYIPAAYPGHITLLIPEDADLETGNDPRLSWRTLAGSGCTHVRITGDRGTMLNHPHVEVLAGKLREQLDECHSRVV